MRKRYRSHFLWVVNVRRAVSHYLIKVNKYNANNQQKHVQPFFSFELEAQVGWFTGFTIFLESIARVAH